MLATTVSPRPPPPPPNPIHSFLQTRYSLKPVIVRHVAALYPKLDSLDMDKVLIPNVTVLEKLTPAMEVRTIICRVPKLLGMDLVQWYEFLNAYGVPDKCILDIIRHCPSVMLNGNIHHFGQVLLQLRGKGYSHNEIIHAILPNNHTFFIPVIPS